MTNRGMSLESTINYANEQYLQRNIAVIHKRETPIKVIQARGARIYNAVYSALSQTDYEGVYQGRSLQFEAKSTEVKTRFDLDNIHPHQIEHLRVCESHGAICFVIVEFTKRNEVFYVPAQLFVRAWDALMRGGPKSIPYDEIAAACLRVTQGRGIVLDYLDIVDKYMHQMAV